MGEAAQAMHQPSLQAMILTLVVSAAYLLYLLRHLIRGGIDLYDLFALSMIALVPCLFVLFPAAAEAIAALLGVAFPFVIMFAGLLLVLFLVVHRLTERLHKLERGSVRLVQEAGLLRAELEVARKVAQQPRDGTDE